MKRLNGNQMAGRSGKRNRDHGDGTLDGKSTAACCRSIQANTQASILREVPTGGEHDSAAVVMLSSQGFESPPQRCPILAVSLPLPVLLLAKEPGQSRFVASQRGQEQGPLLGDATAAGRGLAGHLRQVRGRPQFPEPEIDRRIGRGAPGVGRVGFHTLPLRSIGRSGRHGDSRRSGPLPAPLLEHRH